MKAYISTEAINLPDYPYPFHPISFIGRLDQFIDAYVNEKINERLEECCKRCRRKLLKVKKGSLR